MRSLSLVRAAQRLTLLPRDTAGTAFLALLHPSQQRPTSVPPDGLRYLVAEPNERRTLTRHAVSCPTSLANPTQHQTLQVELECLTSACGHLPPLAPDQPLSPSSPELRLVRFRKRWRITNGQNPSLWFFWWGRDETGGMGQGAAPQAPPGWGSTPVRPFPLLRPPNAPTQPLFPFPSPNRMPLGAPAAAAPAPSPAPGAPPPPGTPQARAPFAHFQQQQPPPPSQGLGGVVGTPQQQAALAAASAATPYARQQQLAQLVANANQAQGVSGASAGGGAAGGVGGANAALEARQAQYQAQQQQAPQAAAGRGYAPSVLAPGGAGAYASGAAAPPPPPGMSAQQASQLQAQQQQQQAYLVAQQRAHAQAQAQAHAQAQPQRRPTMLPSSSSRHAGGAPQPPAAHGPPPPPPLAYDDTLFTDVLDLVSPRQLALHRLATAHDLVHPLFDSPWTARDVVSGAPRRKDMLEVLGTVGISRSTGEVRPGGARAVVPGAGRDGPLGECANAAARIAVRGAMGVEPGAAGGGAVEQRRARLEALLRETEEGIERMEERHEVSMGRRETAAVSPAA